MSDPAKPRGRERQEERETERDRKRESAQALARDSEFVHAYVQHEHVQKSAPCK